MAGASSRRYGAAIEGCLLHEALATLWRFVGAGNRYVDAQQPWVLAKAAKAGDAAAAARLRDVLGELLEACRVIGLAVAPFMPESSARILAAAGPRLPYAPDGNGGPAVGAARRVGRAAATAGTWRSRRPLFPRQDVEPPEPAAPEVSSASQPQDVAPAEGERGVVAGPMAVLMVSRPWLALRDVAEPEHVAELVGRHRAQDDLVAAACRPAQRPGAAAC